MEERAPTPEFRLLGGILVSLVHWPEACVTALNHLQPEHFVDRGNRIILEAVLTLHSEGVTVDLVSIAQYLNHRGMIQDAGGYVRLCELWDWACPPNELPNLVDSTLRAGHQELEPPEVEVSETIEPHNANTVEPFADVDISFNFGANAPTQ